MFFVLIMSSFPFLLLPPKVLKAIPVENKGVFTIRYKIKGVRGFPNVNEVSIVNVDIKFLSPRNKYAGNIKHFDSINTSIYWYLVFMDC